MITIDCKAAYIWRFYMSLMGVHLIAIIGIIGIICNTRKRNYIPHLTAKPFLCYSKKANAMIETARNV